MISTALLADAALLAYEADGAVVRRRLRQAGFDTVHLINWTSPGTQAIVAWCGDAILIAFRGTEPTSVADVVTDLQAHLVPFPGEGRVHAGFLAALDSVWGQVRDLLYQSPNGTPIYLTGHSLGAALATLAAHRLSGRVDVAQIPPWRRVERLCTFGSPRVGDALFVAGLDQVSVRRHVNACDIVARRPWLLALLGYRHVGDVRYHSDGAGIWRSPNALLVAIDRLRAWRRDGLIRSLGDHAMARYHTNVVAGE